MDTEKHPELINPSAFVADNATVIGHVTIGSGASVWFGAVVRGDTEKVVIGERSNVQDLCVLHADPGFPCVIGKDVTIGHAAVVHGAHVGDGAMIGIRGGVERSHDRCRCDRGGRRGGHRGRRHSGGPPGGRCAGEGDS